MTPWAKHCATAFVAATALSGAPSTLVSLAKGDPLLASARAAGTLLPGRRDRPGVVAGGAAHVVISAGWTAVLVPVLRGRGRRGAVLAGAAAGAAIAALDLGLVGRRCPAIAALAPGRQVLDHLAFGAIIGWVVGRSAASRGSG